MQIEPLGELCGGLILIEKAHPEQFLIGTGP